MRIYDGSPRQDFEEVFRSIGAFLDSRGMRDILAGRGARRVRRPGPGRRGRTPPSAWSETVGTITKETLSFFDDDIAKFMEEAAARRGGGSRGATGAGAHERALRVIGHWMDSRSRRTCSCSSRTARTSSGSSSVGQAGAHHTISEFTREDIDTLIEQGPDLRDQPKPGVDRRAAARGRRAGTRGRPAAPAEPPPAEQLGRARQLIARSAPLTGPMTNADVTSAGGAGTINVLTVALEGGPTR